MRSTLVSTVFLLAIAGSVVAADLGQTPAPKPPGHEYRGGGRVGGDTIADAVLIPSLPYADSGNTCGYANDSDGNCLYVTSTSPDVVYRYNPAVDEVVEIDLCASSYDTAVYVWEDSAGNEIVCNDDGCGAGRQQSRIWFAGLQAGHSYYIIVDGYGGDCGEYSITVERLELCDLPCPSGALVEGEPPCADDQRDVYNPGCSGDEGYLRDWLPIPGQPGGCATVCGRSCTYRYEVWEMRDTDWYRAQAAGGVVTLTCRAEFPLMCYIIYGTDCGHLNYVYGQASPCEPLTIEWVAPAAQDVWLWVGPSVFQGVPESDYVFEVCGLSETSGLVGACCFGGTCRILTEDECAFFSGVWERNASCYPLPCGNTGACCLPDGSCANAQMGECHRIDGIWLFPITSCIPNPCGPVPVERTSWGRIKSLNR
ncbi:MAG: hypothetical protein FJY88_07035 [Candidatus Eisenbacteria bacterium]|nr:hypothetical protein [Candidatus Eisenbacteria bacterium]